MIKLYLPRFLLFVVVCVWHRLDPRRAGEFGLQAGRRAAAGVDRERRQRTCAVRQECHLAARQVLRSGPGRAAERRARRRQVELVRLVVVASFSVRLLEPRRHFCGVRREQRQSHERQARRQARRERRVVRLGTPVRQATRIHHLDHHERDALVALRGHHGPQERLASPRRLARLPSHTHVRHQIVYILFEFQNTKAT